VINIELKGELAASVKCSKINDQMAQNYYYLRFLNKKIAVFTFVENDGLYMFNAETQQSQKSDVVDLVDLLSMQTVKYLINPDNLFIPSNYLISPFNNTEKFIKQEFFLTDHQQRIKSEIIDSLDKKEFKMFCISANAGTGKTLLIYEIARSLMQSGKAPLIVHSGILNDGHLTLQNFGLDIIPIRNLHGNSVDKHISADKILLIMMRHRDYMNIKYH